MGARNSISLLKILGNKELREICERYNLKGFSGLKKNELAHFIARSEKISDVETEFAYEHSCRQKQQVSTTSFYIFSNYRRNIKAAVSAGSSIFQDFCTIKDEKRFFQK